MTVNIDPFNTAAIFGVAATTTPQNAGVPQALPRAPQSRVSKATGLPAGLRKALGDAFVADVFADWQIWGPVVIEKMRLDDPVAYAKMVAAILPKEVAIGREAPLAELTDEQLAIVYAAFTEVFPDEPPSGQPAVAAKPDAGSGGACDSANGAGDESSGSPEIID